MPRKYRSLCKCTLLAIFSFRAVGSVYLEEETNIAPTFTTFVACKQALCMGYSEICFRMARSQKLGSGRDRENLQWSLYGLSIYIQILNVNCWLANSIWHMSNNTICVQPWSVDVFSRMFISFKRSLVSCDFRKMERTPGEWRGWGYSPIWAM